MGKICSPKLFPSRLHRIRRRIYRTRGHLEPQVVATLNGKWPPGIVMPHKRIVWCHASKRNAQKYYQRQKEESYRPPLNSNPSSLKSTHLTIHGSLLIHGENGQKLVGIGIHGSSNIRTLHLLLTSHCKPILSNSLPHKKLREICNWSDPDSAFMIMKVFFFFHPCLARRSLIKNFDVSKAQSLDYSVTKLIPRHDTTPSEMNLCMLWRRVPPEPRNHWIQSTTQRKC